VHGEVNGKVVHHQHAARK